MGFLPIFLAIICFPLHTPSSAAAISTTNAARDPPGNTCDIMSFLISTFPFLVVPYLEIRIMLNSTFEFLAG